MIVEYVGPIYWYFSGGGEGRQLRNWPRAFQLQDSLAPVFRAEGSVIPSRASSLTE